MLVRMKPATYTQYTTVTERLGLVKFSEFRISQNLFKRLKRTLKALSSKFTEDTSRYETVE